MTTEKDKISLDLALVSSILNHAGCNGLLNYLSLETYKRIIKDEYVNFASLNKFLFINSEIEWNISIDKLIELKLVNKKGNYYISRSKKKEWRQYMEQNIIKSKKFNGYIIFDMSELYIQKNNKELNDLIYLSILEQVINGKSISREFIKDLTGLDKNAQKKIELLYEGKYLEKIEHHIPVGSGEEINEKVGNIPVFTGVFSPRYMKCVKTSKNKSNCKVIQLGNKLKIKNLKICKFVFPKTTIKKEKSNLDMLNDSSRSDEVQSWDSLDMVIDTSISSNSNKFRGVLSAKDNRYNSWKDFKNYDYTKVKVLNEDGLLVEVRDTLNK